MVQLKLSLIGSLPSYVYVQLKVRTAYDMRLCRTCELS